jgi:Cof subfamily protein (haloacid dehalogenase superfamily)
MTYQALAIDLDGTLLIGEDLPEANRQAVAAASAAGLQIIIATARWRQMAERVATSIGINAPIIACSGAQVYIPDSGQDIFDHRVPQALTEMLYEICNNHRCIATVTGDEHTLLKLDGEPNKSLMDDEMRWVTQLSLDHISQPRIATVQGSAVVKLIRDTLKEAYRDQINIYDSIGPTGRVVLTITNKQANKGAALEVACKEQSIDPSSVIAFGDAENDIAMFNVAGASVAMGNAGDEIKAAATTTTAANTENGVALVINRLLETGDL